MGYRTRQVCQIKYGQFGAYLATVRKVQEICRSRGWAESRLLVPTAGTDNEVILETEYPDLATLQKENEAFYSDEEAFQAFRSGADFVVQGSSRTELLEDVPMVFPGSD